MTYVSSVFSFLLFSFFGLFRAATVAYGGSQARGRTGAAAPAYARATAMRDLSHVCDPHHSSWQRQILTPLGEARDQTSILMDASRVR